MKGLKTLWGIIIPIFPLIITFLIVLMSKGCNMNQACSLLRALSGVSKRLNHITLTTHRRDAPLRYVHLPSLSGKIVIIILITIEIAFVIIISHSRPTAKMPPLRYNASAITAIIIVRQNYQEHCHHYCQTKLSSLLSSQLKWQSSFE